MVQRSVWGVLLVHTALAAISVGDSSPSFSLTDDAQGGTMSDSDLIGMSSLVHVVRGN